MVFKSNKVLLIFTGQNTARLGLVQFWRTHFFVLSLAPAWQKSRVSSDFRRASANDKVLLEDLLAISIVSRVALNDL